MAWTAPLALSISFPRGRASAPTGMRICAPTGHAKAAQDKALGF